MGLFETFRVRVNGVNYVVDFTSADRFVSKPVALSDEVIEKIKGAIWAKLVAPRGPNFRGRKAKQWK